jgi:hypothetical protein
VFIWQPYVTTLKLFGTDTFLPSTLQGSRPRGREDGGMCRSIKALREPYTPDVTDADVRAAALQYVRKISGFRQPAPHNAAAFDEAVAAVAHATAHLLEHLEVRGSAPAARRAEAAS